MYGEDDEYFDTMGEEDFATVGFDEYGNELGVVRARRPGGPARPPGGRGGRGRLPPGRGDDPRRQMAQPGDRRRRRGRARYPLARPEEAGVTEPRVVELIDEQLSLRLPAWFQGASRVPGSSDQAQLMSPLGLGVGTLTTAVNVVTLTAQPQRPFRGERLLVGLARSSGASVVPVRITEFKIGENSQLVGAGALPADAFDPQAFGVRLAMSPSAPGIQIVLRLETDVAAVPAGESISVTGAIIGRAVWGESGGPG